MSLKQIFIKKNCVSLSVATLANFFFITDLVTAMLSGGPEAEEAKVQLADKMQSVKTIANEYKKTSDKN